MNTTDIQQHPNMMTWKTDKRGTKRKKITPFLTRWKGVETEIEIEKRRKDTYLQIQGIKCKQEDPSASFLERNILASFSRSLSEYLLLQALLLIPMESICWSKKIIKIK